MILLGEKQELIIAKKVEFGVYLSEPDDQKGDNKVLLPIKQVPAGAEIGDSINVFIYKDSKDRVIATINEPLLHMGEVKLLPVAQVGNLGAFLNWGLEKDLFLPFREQTYEVKEGDQCLVTLYIDKSERLCATMKVYHFLDLDSPYQKEEKVTGLVYEISREFGAFVAVDNQFSGLISTKELYGSIKAGDIVTARVVAVKEDGKLDLSIREKAHVQMNIDAEKVRKEIETRGGSLPFTDKASPELIRSELQMSKNEFKRAVGNLLKAGEIIITETEIKGIEK